MREISDDEAEDYRLQEAEQRRERDDRRRLHPYTPDCGCDCCDQVYYAAKRAAEEGDDEEEDQ